MSVFWGGVGLHAAFPPNKLSPQLEQGETLSRISGGEPVTQKIVKLLQTCRHLHWVEKEKATEDILLLSCPGFPKMIHLYKQISHVLLTLPSYTVRKKYLLFFLNETNVRRQSLLQSVQIWEKISSYAVTARYFPLRILQITTWQLFLAQIL